MDILVTTQKPTEREQKIIRLNIIKKKIIFIKYINNIPINNYMNKFNIINLNQKLIIKIQIVFKELWII